jgi:hypothetical protein
MKPGVVAMLFALMLAGCASGPHYWTKPGATAEMFKADHDECARGAAVGYGIGSERAYKACLSQKDWVRIQGRGTQPPDVPHFRGIEGDDEFARPSPETPITDLKELAGSWEGWVTTRSGEARLVLIIQADGNFEASTPRGASTVGRFYLNDGKLRYRSSRTEGSAALSIGKTILTLTFEGISTFTGQAVLERVK